MSVLGDSPLSTSQEDYLKQIFLLTEKVDSVSTQALAQRLDVRPPSVSGMLKKLSELELIDHQPYRGVRLTESGRAEALRLLRRHRLLECFLHDVLGYSWDEVHEEAEKLEHVISAHFARRMAEALGDPSYDPHGDPIPRPDLTIPESRGLDALTEIRPGQRARLARVLAQDSDSLNLLARLGLTPGAELEVLESRVDAVRVETSGQRYLLPEPLASELRVEVV